MNNGDVKRPGAWLKPGNYTPWIIGISVLIYVLVGLLFRMPGQHKIAADSLRWMPMVNAILNSFTFIFLLTAYVAIRRKKVEVHRRFILAAFGTTALFLITYVGYHFLTESTRYGGTGALKVIYLLILLTHVVLAAVITPFALFSVVSGLQMDVQRHRRIARWTMPLWLYVSLTGVIVYLMIRPYY